MITAAAFVVCALLLGGVMFVVAAIGAGVWYAVRRDWPEIASAVKTWREPAPPIVAPSEPVEPTPQQTAPATPPAVARPIYTVTDVDRVIAAYTERFDRPYVLADNGLAHPVNTRPGRC